MAKRLLGGQMTRIRNSYNTDYTNEAMLPLSVYLFCSPSTWCREEENESFLCFIIST